MPPLTIKVNPFLPEKNPIICNFRAQFSVRLPCGSAAQFYKIKAKKQNRLFGSAFFLRFFCKKTEVGGKISKKRLQTDEKCFIINIIVEVCLQSALLLKSCITPQKEDRYEI